MQADSLLVFLLLFLAAGAGWAGARWYFGRRRETPSRPVSPDYLKGLSYLLEDKPDKAIEVFVSLMEVDNETIETHFALGSLFRRRGEVDRAIRIHQNIIARPNLPRTQRDQALYALAEDYLRAGLFDRAEKLFDRLVASSSLKTAALAKLTRIYEEQKDWNQAISARRRRPDGRSAENEQIVAHYYCELAEDAMSQRDLVAARQLLKKARSIGPWQPRGALMRARLALAEGDKKTASRLFRRIVESDGRFVTEVWPALREGLEDGEGRGSFGRFLDTVIRKQPAMDYDVAYGAIMHGDVASAPAARCVERFVRDSPPLRAALTELGSVTADEPLEGEALQRVAAALGALLRNRSAYLCSDCGYRSDQLYWQCPSCKNWDTIRPNTRLPVERLALAGGK